MSKLIITEEEKKLILNKYVQNPLLNEQKQFLAKLFGSSVDDIFKGFGDDAIKSLDDLFAKVFTKSGNLINRGTQQFIKSASGSEIPMKTVQEAIELVGKGKLKPNQVLDYLPRNLADGTEFRSVVKQALESKGVQKVTTKNLSNIRKKITASAVTPIGYHPLTPLAVPGELMLPKMAPKTWATQNRMDAWYLYNGLEPKYSTFEKIGENTYKIKKFNVEEDTLKKIIDYPSNKFASAKIENELNFGAIHGNGMIEKGVDEFGRKFIEFSDLWDLQPLKKFKILPNKLKNFEVSSVSGGKPFWTKNRIYYDELGNVFDSEGEQLIKKTESINVKGGGFKGDVTYYRTKNLGNTTQQEILDDWDKLSSYGMVKAMVLPFATMVGLIIKGQLDSKKLYLKIVKIAKEKNMSIGDTEKWCQSNVKECELLLK